MSRKLNMANAALLGRAGTRAANLFGVDETRSLRELDMDAVSPNPLQPRRHFDEETIAALAASIERHGLLQPICVRETQANRYQIIAGERRWRAFQQLGRKTVPALVIQTDDPATLALIENLQREDLGGLETAEALSVLLQERGVSHEQLGALIGKSQAYVSRMLGILALPRGILNDCAANRHVPASALMIVAETKDPTLRAALWEQAKAGLSVRGLTQARKAAETQVPADAAPPRRAKDKTPGATAAQAARKTTAALQNLSAQGAALSAEETETLQALRRAIDALLG